MGTYVKRTNRRRYEDRKFSVRPVHRDAPDLHKLCEVLIRLTLQESGQSRIDRRAAEPPGHLPPGNRGHARGRRRSSPGRGRNGRMKPTSLASSVACCGPKPHPGIGAGKRYVVDLSA